MIPLDRDASRPIKTFPPVARGYSHTPQVRRHSGSPHFLPSGCLVPLTAGTFFPRSPGNTEWFRQTRGSGLCHAAPARSVSFSFSGHVLSGFPVLRMTQLSSGLVYLVSICASSCRISGIRIFCGQMDAHDPQPMHRRGSMEGCASSG